MIKKILVIGGTGLLGFPVARQLKQDGFNVDILTTNPKKAEAKYGSQYVYRKGDVRDGDLLMEIFKEYQGIHINLNSGSYKELHDIELIGCRNITQAAKHNAMKKMTMISGLGVSQANAHIPFIKSKLEMERMIKDTGIPYTIFNCTHFMESIPLYIRNGKAMIMGNQSARIHWLSAEDYASMVSKAYLVGESDFHNYSLVGPEAYTMREVFEKYVERIDPTIKMTKVSLRMLGLIAAISFNAKLKYLVDLMRYFEKTSEKYDPEDLPYTLGTADTTLDDWLTQK